jgi:hypothetical protein
MEEATLCEEVLCCLTQSRGCRCCCEVEQR